MRLRHSCQDSVKARLAIMLLIGAVGVLPAAVGRASVSGEPGPQAPPPAISAPADQSASTPAPVPAPAEPAAQASAATQPATADPSAQAPALPPPDAPDKKPVSPQDRERIQQALLKDVFTFEAKDMTDPFEPFFKPPAPKLSTPSLTAEDEEAERLPEPLTPLQKMTIAEIEKGLKGIIIIGPEAKRALIEDPTGKGYIIDVGVPLGEMNGMVTQIFGDGLVIQQRIASRASQEPTVQTHTVRLKKTEKTR
ncbi:MAG: hypothetical protein ABFD98_04420 [Syntrophobacteraceae bacterium]|nr:hypothetical protein [Desulfobacteraceae bacterium]